MKILHAADLHLDTAFTGRSEEQVRFLKKELLRIPEKLLRLQKNHSCDLVLLSGDLFDGPHTADSLQILKAALAEMAVPVFISPGNHDFCSPDSPYLTDIWPENVHIFTKPAMESLPLPQLSCRVYGAGFAAMDCPALLENFRAEGEESYHIGLLHGDPLQRNSPYNPITQSQVAASGLQYLALGHVHKAGSFTAETTLCAWPGCPMGRGNDETGEKGVYIVTLEDSATVEFIPLDGPKFFDWEVEVLTTAEEAVRSALPPVGNQDFYCVTLTGEWAGDEDLSFPEFPNLEIRNRTLPPTDLWSSLGQDNLEGTYFRLLHDSLETADAEAALLAAKISRKILDGREVVLP